MTDTMLEDISDNPTHQTQIESLLEEKQPSPRDKSEGWKIPNMRERLKESKYRSKLKRSWLIAGAFFNMGLTVGLTGTTLLDLQIITGTDLERASAFVTGFTGGYMVGCLVAGVIFSQMDVNLLLFVSMSGMGAALIVTPFCSNYILMIVMRVTCGFFTGGINTTGNAGHMQIWGKDGKVLMQIIHFCFALGGLISPLYSQPFLAERSPINETDTANFTNGNNTTMFFISDPETTNVHYAFILSGAVIIVCSLSFLALFVKTARKTKRLPHPIVETNISQRELPLSLYIFLLIMLCSFFMSYSSTEVSFFSFIIAFLVNEYDFVTKATGVYITAIFWISFAASRFVMIFASHLLSAVSLLFLCLTLMMIAFTGFYISAIYGAIPALSVFTAIAGLGMSGVYAGGYAWTESELMKVTAKVTSSICVIASTGSIVVPLVLGFLMENLGNMWFCYVLVSQTANTFLLFIFLLLFNRHYVNKRYNSLDLLRNSELVVANPQSLVTD